jgi:NADPH2:quinone reductase
MGGDVGLMKAIQFDAFGGPEVLVVRDVPVPEPKDGEVRIKASAIAVNFTDVSLRSGLYPLPLPSGLGVESAGIVDAVGPGVEEFKVGDRVVCTGGPAGAYAEARCVPQGRVLAAPSDLSDEILVSIMMKAFTAQYLLRQTFEVREGQAIFFHSAAGGVGSIATQWAKALGATVLGGVGSDDKAALARANGCDEVFNTRESGWAAKVRERTAGRGVEVVYDCVGKDTFEESIACLAPRGAFVSFGIQSGPMPPLDLNAMRGRGSFSFTATAGGHYNTTRDAFVAAFEEILAVVRAGKVRVDVNHRFRLDEARQAHEALQARATTGSIVLIP